MKNNGINDKAFVAMMNEVIGTLEKDGIDYMAPISAKKANGEPRTTQNALESALLSSLRLHVAASDYDAAYAYSIIGELLVSGQRLYASLKETLAADAM